MARTTADATRFTSTGPHAYARGASSTINPSQAPANETPQQKVARLREAARQARLGQESTFDKVVTVGRKWADRAHKVTVTALIGLGIGASGIAIYATTDMMMYNRRKRREWFAEQQIKYDFALGRARAAEASGTLTPDLALILNKERAIEQAELEQQNKKGLLSGAKEWIFGGLAKKERIGGAMGLTSEEFERAVQASGAQTQRTTPSPTSPSPSPAPDGPQPSTTSQQVRQSLQPQGGLLDQYSENVSQAFSQSSRGLYDRLRGR